MMPLLLCIHGGGCNAGYFDLPGFSTAAAALKRGLPVLLVNRPGHGGNPPLHGNRQIEHAARLIRAFVDEVRSEHLPGCAGIAIIGHSIGGAVALTMASARGDWPLRGVAVSGIGEVPTPAVRDWWSAPDPDLFVSAEAAVRLFLGPEGTYSWRAPIALRKSSEPWCKAEVAEVIREWPRRLPELASRIDVPVHLRLADHDRIWESSDTALAQFRARFHNAPRADAGILPDGGHLYEIHIRGHELVQSQLAFLTGAT